MIRFEIRKLAAVVLLGLFFSPPAKALSANIHYDGFFRAIRRGEVREFLRRYRYEPDILIVEQFAKESQYVHQA